MWKPVVMSSHQSDLVFAGSIPDLYEHYLVPMIFQPYADDLARRLADLHPDDVLELAAGTGAVTRALASRLPPSTAITATDLNQPMIDHAAAIGAARPVTWQQADAVDLPFDDVCFDAVVCQFGVMFFPDRHKAFTEMRRVLRPGGSVVFNVWDRLEQNQFETTVTDALATMFPDDPPRFLARTPHGYHDTERIRADLVAAGFNSLLTIDTVPARSLAASCNDPAIGFCQGTPLRNEILTRDPDGLADATSVAAQLIAERFGESNIDGAMSAHVVTARKV
jgi:SAM-dependent methyltransferase